MRHSEHKGMACDKARRLADLYMLDDPRLSAGRRSLPAAALLTDGRVTSAWEEKAPDFDEIMQQMRSLMKTGKIAIFGINKLRYSNA